MKDNDPPIAVAKIDATSASMLASKFDVSGYPTIKILKKGQAVDYDGSRTQEGELQDVSCWGMVPKEKHLRLTSGLWPPYTGIYTFKRKHTFSHAYKWSPLSVSVIVTVLVL